MATKTSLILNSVTQSGVKNQKTLTDVNAEASSSVLKEFAEKLNALTTNTYGSTTRVDKGTLANSNGLTPVEFRVVTVAEIWGDAIPTAYATDDPYHYKLKLWGAAEREQYNLDDPPVNGGHAGWGFQFCTNTDATPRILSQPTYGAMNCYSGDDGFESAEVTYSPVNEALAHVYSGICVGAIRNVNPPLSQEAIDGSLGDYVIYFPQTETFAPATLTFTLVAE